MRYARKDKAIICNVRATWSRKNSDAEADSDCGLSCKCMHVCSVRGSAALEQIKHIRVNGMNVVQKRVSIFIFRFLTCIYTRWQRSEEKERERAGRLALILNFFEKSKLVRTDWLLFTLTQAKKENPFIFFFPISQLLARTHSLAHMHAHGLFASAHLVNVDLLKMSMVRRKVVALGHFPASSSSPQFKAYACEHNFVVFWFHVVSWF